MPAGPCSTRSPKCLLALQIGIGLAGLMLLVMAPPRDGRIWLVPLTQGAAEGLAVSALRSGSALLERGPIDGTLIVQGSSSALARSGVGRDVLMLAAPLGGCARQPS